MAKNNSIVKESKRKARGYTRKVPLLCKLGFHDWSVKVYHDEAGSYVEHSVKVCKRCGKEVKGTRKMAWDKS